MTALVLIGSGLVGAALAYMLDPDRGRRRRALARDRVVSAASAAGEALETTGRDVANRTRGLIAGIRSRLQREDVPDEVLAERVRAAIGGAVSHPAAIEISVRGGRVTLGGVVLASGVDRLVNRVAAVRGVLSVQNALEVEETPGSVRGLPGQEPEAPAGRLWSPAARLLAGLGGLALAIGGLRRRGLLGASAAGGGLALLARATTNLESRRLIGVGAASPAVVVDKTIELNAPVPEVFEIWQHYENFPRFMSHVREVRRITAERSRWTVAGPGGIPVHWEAVVTEFMPNQLIAWRSELDSTIQQEGRVRFEPSGGGTRVAIRIAYTPVAGAVGHAVAALLGRDPRRMMDDDLMRLKSLLEEGRTTGAEGTVYRRELS